MIKLADVNVLVYAMRQASPYHNAAIQWLEAALDTDEAFGWHPLVGASVIRIATNPRVFANPSTVEQCSLFIDKIVAAPATTRILEGERFWSIFTQLLHRYHVAGPRGSDIYWAALAIENDAGLCSADRSFGQYVELRWIELSSAG